MKPSPRRVAPDPAYDLRRIRKQQRKAPRARLRIMIAGNPLHPIRTISLPAALPTVVFVLAGALLLGAAILACGSWKLSDARASLERRVRSMIQAADAMALSRTGAQGPDDPAAAFGRGRGRSTFLSSANLLRPESGGIGRFVVQSANNGEEMEIAINLGSGEMEVDSYRRLRHLMRCLHTGAETPIDPRLIDLLYRIAQRTQHRIILVSGFRAPMYSLARLSYHTRGMAADIRIPGMTALMARDLAESMGVHGLGYYPVSGFIHVDVRDERMRWTDYGANRFDSERTEHGTAQGEVAERDSEPNETAPSEEGPAPPVVPPLLP
jgi:uncharacterized protein YcbK (DUF882 family)